MFTKGEFNEIGLDVDVLTGNAAVEWISKNTTLDVSDINKLSASAVLFIKKFDEINGTNSGVTSESIGGLSQSFNTSDKSALLLQFAEELFSEDELKIGKVRFVAASPRWK